MKYITSLNVGFIRLLFNGFGRPSIAKKNMIFFNLFRSLQIPKQIETENFPVKSRHKTPIIPYIHPDIPTVEGSMTRVWEHPTAVTRHGSQRHRRDRSLTDRDRSTMHFLDVKTLETGPDPSESLLDLLPRLGGTWPQKVIGKNPWEFPKRKK